jgi:DICT domain-containing protein/signal transduction histidine kinase
MSILTSLLKDLLQAQPHLRSQMYFKSSMVALARAMKEQVLAGSDQPLVIASFQRERFYRQETRRYLQIAERTNQVYVLAAPETGFRNGSDHFEMIAFGPSDALGQEWHLVIIGQQYASCMCLREQAVPLAGSTDALLKPMDQARRFEGIWTFDRQVSSAAAQLLLRRILVYRPELSSKVEQALAQLAIDELSKHQVDPAPFTARLVTYLQAGEYKLLKAYRSITAQERKERLVNSMTSAIRRSLNPDEVLEIAVQELGQALQSCRCLIYRCKVTDATATLEHEYLGTEVMPLAGQVWPLQENPLFQEVVQKQEPVYLEDTQTDHRLAAASSLRTLVEHAAIRSWLMVPVFYQGRLLGILELHNCSEATGVWNDQDLALVEAIATQVGVALIQAEAYAEMENLNQQLEALERTRSNLIAVTGHELRTPLSTIQVCLESLASEPDMSLELRQVMLSTALGDAERLRTLVEDFLTLSRLESGRVKWHLEALSLSECVELALSSIRARQSRDQLPQITTQIPSDLPLVWADGEWLVQLLSKLLDNACKFTDSQGNVTIQAQPNGGQMLEVTVVDTGRGIEPNRLEAVFDRFYQEEGALRRTTGGTGLGLAICRRIVTALGGKIWAESAGKNQGSQFHLTIPSAAAESEATSQFKGDGKQPVSDYHHLRATLH